MANNHRDSIISSKRGARDTAVAVAPTYDALAHSSFTTATGTFSPPSEARNTISIRRCLTATEIVRRIGAGEWTASQVLEAYIACAARAQSTSNCLTEGQ